MKIIELTKDMIDNGLTLRVHGCWDDWHQAEGQIIKVEEYNNYYELTNKSGKITEFKKRDLESFTIHVLDDSRNYKKIYEWKRGNC